MFSMYVQIFYLQQNQRFGYFLSLQLHQIVIYNYYECMLHEVLLNMFDLHDYLIFYQDCNRQAT